MADEIKKEDKLGKILEFLNEKGVFKKIKLINKELIENGEKEIIDLGFTTKTLENVILFETKNNAVTK